MLLNPSHQSPFQQQLAFVCQMQVVGPRCQAQSQRTQQKQLTLLLELRVPGLQLVCTPMEQKGCGDTGFRTRDLFKSR